MFDADRFVADHEAHLDRLSEIDQHVESLSELSKHLEIETSPSIPHLVQRIQVRHFLSAINEINGVMCYSAKSSKYSVAEALARISVEMSSNLLFVLGGDKHARSKGLIKHHLDHTKAKFRKWSAFAIRTGSQPIQHAADRSLRSFEHLEAAMAGLTEKPFESWPPSALARFVAIGQEERYRTLFASSSDSVHLLGEDIVNLTLCESAPSAQRASLFAAVRSEKASFAVYLVITSAMFQAEAIDAVAQKVGMFEIDRNRLDATYASLCRLCETHESDAKAHRPNTTS
jgi:hypothetical protein